MATTLLYLVRHAQPDDSVDESSDPGLSVIGRQQAHRLGQRLINVPFDAMRHSPLRRATQTAEILAPFLPDVPVTSSELLADRTPIPSADEIDNVPSHHLPFLEHVPAHERDPEARQLSATLEQLTRTGTDDRVELLVTHNFVIGWFVRHAMDAPAWRWMGLNQFNCALTIVQIRTGRPPTLISFNDVGHLPTHLRGHSPIALHS